MGFVTKLYDAVFGGGSGGGPVKSPDIIKSTPPPITLSSAPPVPSQAPQIITPSVGDPGAMAGAEVARQRAAAAAGAGFSGTIASTPQGVTGTPMTAAKTLLGS